MLLFVFVVGWGEEEESSKESWVGRGKEERKDRPGRRGIYRLIGRV